MPPRQPSMRSDLQDVLITVARIDERMVTMFNRQEDIEERVNSMDKKIQLISPAFIRIGSGFPVYAGSKL